MTDYLYFRREKQLRTTNSALMLTIHEYLRNVLVLPPERIIQQHQRDPPIMDMTQDWLSFGISNRFSGWGTTKQVEESLSVKRYQDLTVSAIFYGDECERNAEMLKDSFVHADNQSFLNSRDMIQVDFGDIVSLPELVNEQWIRRCDCIFKIRHLTLNEFDMPTILEVTTKVF